MPGFLASISLSSPCQCANFSFFTPVLATFPACLSLLLFFLRFLLILFFLFIGARAGLDHYLYSVSKYGDVSCVEWVDNMPFDSAS